ncbi:MAG: hypothetical protein ACOCUT_02905 [bacterium]
MMIYSIPKGNSAIRFAFNRALFPYNLQSHFGKYSRKSNGILKEYDKLANSVISFDKKYFVEVKNIVNKYEITAKFFEVKEI